MAYVTEEVREQQQRDEALAGMLGITYNELMQCQWSYQEDIGNDNAVYGRYIAFAESSPPHILHKIKGLEEDNRVEIDNFDFDADFDEGGGD
jgi:hypothetical protein